MRKIILTTLLLICSSQSAIAWQYSDNKDEMRGTTLHVASLESTNSNEYSYPYNGGSKLKIILLGEDGKITKKAGLILSKGQISCNSNDNCKVYARFDQGEVESLDVKLSGEGNDTIAVFDAPAFTEKLRISKTVFIELPIYREGKSQFKFNPAGLLWRGAPDNAKFLSIISNIPLGEKISTIPEDSKLMINGSRCFNINEFKLDEKINAVGKANVCTYDGYVFSLSLQYPIGNEVYKQINTLINRNLGAKVKESNDVSMWGGDETGGISSIFLFKSKKDGVSLKFGYNPASALIPPVNK